MALARSHRFAALVAVLLLLQGMPVTLLVRVNLHGPRCVHCTGTFCVKRAGRCNHHHGMPHHGMPAGHMMPSAPEASHASLHAVHGASTPEAAASTAPAAPAGATICPCDKSDGAPAMALLLDKVLLPETPIGAPPVRTHVPGTAVATAAPSPFVVDIFHPPSHL